MSRCFPYQRPGYVKNGVKNEELAALIKLQGEAEKAKKDRKKEKKRKKKEKVKFFKNGNVKEEKHSHKKRHKDERGEEDEKSKRHRKGREEPVHHFENSSLTEEHGQQVNQNSSDSTLTSSQRQKLSPDKMHSAGSILGIQLPLLRQRDSELLPVKEQHCPNSGRSYMTCVTDMHDTASRPCGDDEVHPSCVSGSVARGITSTLLNSSSEASQSFYQEANRVSLPNSATLSVSSKQPVEKVLGAAKLTKFGSRPSSIESRLKDLIGSLTPQASHSQSLELDQSWLFDANKRKSAVRRCEVKSTEGLLSVGFSLSPCALPFAPSGYKCFAIHNTILNCLWEG